MKTYRLVSIDIQHDANMKKLPIIEGLIINKEDEGKHWLIEALVQEDSVGFFDNKQEANESFNVKVKITTEENPPVPFKAVVLSVKKFETSNQILLNAERAGKS